MFIENTLKQNLKSKDLCEVLKDGIILCQLAQAILGPNSIPFILEPATAKSQQRQNLIYFITALDRANIPRAIQVTFSDFENEQNFFRVIECLDYLSTLHSGRKEERSAMNVRVSMALIASKISLSLFQSKPPEEREEIEKRLIRFQAHVRG